MKAAACALFLLILAGCAGHEARKLVEAQKPGTSVGAGATLTGPTNSSAPSTQKATRVIHFAPPAVAQVALPTPVIPSVELKAQDLSQPAPSVPSAVYEHVETSLGQHQDATALIKAAGEMSKWTTHRWIGFVGVFIGVGGVLWSYKNEESGYPMVYVKIIIVSTIVMLVDNPWWLLLGLLPLAFYMAQKLNLLRL